MEKGNQPLLSISQQIGATNVRPYTFYIVVAVVVVLELLIGGFLGSQMFNNVSATTASLTTLNQETERLESAVGVLEGIDAGHVKESLTSSERALPSEKKVSGIISSLTTLASSSGVVVNQLELTPCNISTRSAKPKLPGETGPSCENVKLQNGVSGVPLSMQISASEPQMQNFVAKLHKVSPLLGLRTIDYAISFKGKLADLTVLLYFQPIPADLVKFDQLSEISPSEDAIVEKVSSQQSILP